MKKPRKAGNLAAFVERQTPKPAEPEPDSTAEKKEQQLFYLHPDGRRELRVAAAEHGSSISDVVCEALNDWFRKNGKPPLA